MAARSGSWWDPGLPRPGTHDQGNRSAPPISSEETRLWTAAGHRTSQLPDEDPAGSNAPPSLLPAEAAEAILAIPRGTAAADMAS